MKKFSIGILAHVDAGKTTLTEALLYHAGQIRTLGRVDHGDSFLDQDEQERRRGITIFSKQARLQTPNAEITILDTPGHADFSAETERTLQVLDYAVLVISGTEGIQGHTRTLWKLLRHYDVPVFLFVNKMDLSGADRTAIMKELKEGLSPECTDFSPSENAASGHADWLEEVSLASEEMMEQFLEKGSIPDSMITDAILSRKLFPVWFGSALKLEGTETFLKGLDRFAKSKIYPDAFGARIYKIGRDAQGNRLSYLKITGGTLKVRDAISYGDLTEKVTEIRCYNGEKYSTSGQADAGDICAVTGLSSTHPGQGIGADPSGSTPILEPVLTYALRLPPEVNALDFYRRVRELDEEDPELHIFWDEDHKEIHIQIMGQIQIEILTHLIRERLGVAVEFDDGSIIYKETIAKPVEGVGHFEPLRHYAEVHLLLEPGERGSGVQVFSSATEDSLDLHWQRLVLTHILERDHRGVLTGSGLTDVRITLLSGKANLKHTEGGDFRQATYRAIRQGLKSTESILLEPYYVFTLEVPQSTVGRALTDLTDRSGKPEPPEFFRTASGDMARITGTVPVSTMNGYIREVQTYTHGEGSLTLDLNGYDLCHNPEEVIRAARYDSELDQRNPTGSVFCAHGAGFYVPWNQVPQYMHLPYSFVPEELKDEYEANEDYASFGSENDWGKGARKKSTGSSLQEDADLEAIYEREFGHRSERSIMEEKRKWSQTAERDRPIFRQKVDKHGKPIYPKQDTREDYLIIDGYNIIFDWEELRELMDRDINAARGRLLDIISNYQGYTGKKITIVFDAYQTDRTPETMMKYDHLDIVFTQKDQTADAYIERTVHEQGSRYHITVATSDALEQLTVMRLGALRMSAGMLKEEIDRVTKG